MVDYTEKIWAVTGARPSFESSRRDRAVLPDFDGY